jgi:hypothetical protein
MTRAGCEAKLFWKVRNPRKECAGAGAARKVYGVAAGIAASPAQERAT